METTKVETAHFVAALEGVELSREQQARIASGIQEVVMRELASIDTKGDLAISRQFKMTPSLKPGDLIRGIRLKVVQQQIFG